MNAPKMQRYLLTSFWLIGLLVALPFAVIGFLPIANTGLHGRFGIGLLSLLAGLSLTLIRWNYRLEWPRTRGIVLLLLSPLSALLGLGLELPWLYGLAFALFCMAFWVSHHERASQARLTSLWPVLVGFVGLPFALQLSLSEFYSPLFSRSLRAGLEYFAVPHAKYPIALILRENTIYFDQATLSWLWPLGFVAAAGIYSAYLRRPTLQSMVNVLLAIATCFIFGFGYELTEAVLGDRKNDAWSSSWQLLAGWLLTSCLLFLSLERLSRVALHPIGDSFLPQRANPFVMLWNLATGDQATQLAVERRIESKRSNEEHSVHWLRLSLASVTLPVLIAASAWLIYSTQQAWPSNKHSPLATATTAIETFEHRRLTQLDSASGKGRLIANVWSRLNPLRIEEITLYEAGLSEPHVSAIASARGWQLSQAISFEELREKQESGQKNQAKQPTTFYQTAYINSRGEVVKQEDGATNLEQLFTIQIIAQFLDVPSIEDVELLQQRVQEVASFVGTGTDGKTANAS